MRLPHAVLLDNNEPNDASVIKPGLFPLSCQCLFSSSYVISGLEPLFRAISKLAQWPRLQKLFSYNLGIDVVKVNIAVASCLEMKNLGPDTISRPSI